MAEDVTGIEEGVMVTNVKMQISGSVYQVWMWDLLASGYTGCVNNWLFQYMDLFVYLHLRKFLKPLVRAYFVYLM